MHAPLRGGRAEHDVLAHDAGDAGLHPLRAEEGGEKLGWTRRRMVFARAEGEAQLARTRCGKRLHGGFQIDAHGVLPLALAYDRGLWTRHELRQLLAGVRSAV